MPRKKPAAAPAAEKKPRAHVAPRPRALAALKTIALAVKGSPGCEVCVADLKLALEALPDDWQPARAPSGPLQVGQQVECKHATTAQRPEYSHLSAPYTIRTLYDHGRERRCIVVDRAGQVAAGLLINDLRRARPSEQP